MGDSPVQRYQRTWLTCTWIAAFGLFPLLTGAVGAARAAGLWGHHGAVNGWAIGVCIGWAAIGSAAGVRSAMVAVVATPDELIIRNFFATRRIRWTDVHAIDRPRPWVDAGRFSGFYNRRNGLHIRLTDGSTEIATAFTPARWDGRGFADAVIEVLRRYANLAKRRQAPGVSGPSRPPARRG